jgi:SGNH domain (fused to AT3 domains)
MPIIMFRRPGSRNPKVIFVAVALLGAIISAFTPQTALASGRQRTAGSTTGQVVPTSQVLGAVQAAQSLQSVPKDVRPSLTDNGDTAGPGFGKDFSCKSGPPNKAKVPGYGFGECSYGDLKSSKLMVVYGDSHAGMWGEALQYIALRAGWRLVTFYLYECPDPNYNYISWQTNSPDKQCSEFHAIAPGAIDGLHPQLVVVTSEAEAFQVNHRGVLATSTQWQTGWEKVFQSLRRPGTRVVMIGDIPQWSNNDAYCLAAHMSDVQACAASPKQALAENVAAERAAAAASRVQYISPEPWICARQCEPIVDGIRVFNDQYHLTGTYVAYLSGALQHSLDIPDAS